MAHQDPVTGIVATQAEAESLDLVPLIVFAGVAVWKLAILLEGSYKRNLAGSTADPFFVKSADVVPRLAARALRYSEPASV